MSSPFAPPRQVKIGDAASFVGTTPRAIRHYHQLGLLPEPERGSDDRRRYGYDEMIRLLWIRTMADAGIALVDIRDAWAGTGPGGDEGGDEGGDRDITDSLERLDRTLAAREAELQRQRSAVQRMRARGSRLGLLPDLVAGRLEHLPEGALRQADLDSLLVTERVFGAVGAAIQATRFVALATHPDLREQSDRVDAAEAALDDSVAVDDPRVAQVAAERHAFELALDTVVEDSGLAQDDEAFLDSWDAASAAGGADEADRGGGRPQPSMSAVDATRMMPYDFSPARLRCLELADELAGHRPGPA